MTDVKEKSLEDRLRELNFPLINEALDKGWEPPGSEDELYKAYSDYLQDDLHSDQLVGVLREARGKNKLQQMKGYIENIAEEWLDTGINNLYL